MAKKTTKVVSPQPGYNQLLDTFLKDERFVNGDETKKQELLSRFFDIHTSQHIASQGFDPERYRDQFIDKYSPKKKELTSEVSGPDSPDGLRDDEILANKEDARLDEQRLAEKDSNAQAEPQKFYAEYKGEVFQFDSIEEAKALQEKEAKRASQAEKGPKLQTGFNTFGDFKAVESEESDSGEPALPNERNVFKTAKESLKQLWKNAKGSATASVVASTAGAGATGTYGFYAGSQSQEEIKTIKDQTNAFRADLLVDAIQAMEPDPNRKTELVQSLSQIKDPVDGVNFVVNSLGQSVPQILMSVASFGTSGFVQEFGGSYIQSVKKIADEKGISVEEAVKQNLDNPALDVLIGGINASLEYVGAKGATKGLTKKLGETVRDTALKRFGNVVKAAGGEGLTEASQGVITEVGTNVGSGKNALEGVEAQGVLDEFAFGFVGGGGMSGGKAVLDAAGGALDAKNKRDADKANNAISPVESILKTIEQPNSKHERTELKDFSDGSTSVYVWDNENNLETIKNFPDRESAEIFADEVAKSINKRKNPDEPKPEPTSSTKVDEKGAESVNAESQQTGETDVQANIFVSPYYDKTVKNTKGAKVVRRSKAFQQFRERVSQVAKSVGVTIEGTEEAVGGYELDSGDRIREVSDVIQVKGTNDDVELFGALTGLIGPEVQESTIVSRSVESEKEGNIDEISIKVDNLDGAIDVLDALDVNYTLNEKAGRVSIHDFSKNKKEQKAFLETLKLVDQKFEENNINHEQSERQRVSSNLIDSKKRKEILSRNSDRALQQGESGANLHNLIQQAIAKNEEFLQKPRKVAGLTQEQKSTSETKSPKAKQEPVQTKQNPPPAETAETVTETKERVDPKAKQAQDDVDHHSSEVESISINIEDAQEELASLKRDLAAVRKNKSLSKEEKLDQVDEHKDLIESVQFDLSEYKAELREAKRNLKKAQTKLNKAKAKAPSKSSAATPKDSQAQTQKTYAPIDFDIERGRNLDEFTAKGDPKKGKKIGLYGTVVTERDENGGAEKALRVFIRKGAGGFALTVQPQYGYDSSGVMLEKTFKTEKEAVAYSNSFDYSTLKESKGSSTDQAQTQKTYAKTTKTHQQKGRIEPDPLPHSGKGNPKPIRKIVADLNRSLKRTKLFKTRSQSKGVLGWYKPASGSIGVKSLQDLDVLAHEYGHSLDDLYGVLSKIPAVLKPYIMSELSPFAKFGSKPPASGLSQQQKADYLLGEGVAEYIRARLVNPTQAEKMAPQFTKWFDSRLSDRAKKEFKAFSDDLRTFSGLSGAEKTMSNIEMTWETERQGLFDAALEEISEMVNPDKQVFKTTLWDRLQAGFIDPHTVADKATKWLMDAQDKKVLAKNDPRKLVRLLYGLNGKLDNILTKGMVKGDLSRLIDEETGQNMNLEWLLEPYDNSAKDVMQKEIKLALAWMVSKRAMEMNAKAIKAEVIADIKAGHKAPYTLMRLFPEIAEAQKQYNPKKPTKGVKAYLNDRVLTGAGAGIFADLAVAKQTLDEVSQMDDETKTRIEEASRRYKEMANSVLDYMADKGRISRDEVNLIKDNNMEYVAMRRIVETEPGKEVEIFEKSKGGGGVATVKKVIHKQHGSLLTIKDPYGSLIETMAKGLKEADRNEVMNAYRELWDVRRGMGEGEQLGLGQIATKVDTNEAGTVTIFVDGKPEYWRIGDEDFLKAIKGVDHAAGQVEAALQWYAKIVRVTVTTAPQFAIRNKFRDQLTRLVISNSVGRKGGTGHSIYFNKKDREKIENLYELVGGSQSGYHLLDDNFYRKTMEEAINTLSKDKNTFLFNPWAKYRKAIEFSETSTRLEEYKSAFAKAKKDGLDDYSAAVEAGVQARGLLDFQVMGHWVRRWNKVLPFLNAGIQGTAREVRAFRDNPAGTLTKWFIVQTLPSLLVRAMIHEMGDEYDEAYEQLPAWRRDLFWNLPISPDNWIAIPRGFFMASLASGMERLFSKFVYDEKNAFDGYTGSLARALIPVDEGAILAGPFKPLVEIATNYSFFKQSDIISKFEENRKLEDRSGTVRASRLGKAIGNAANWDPRYVDHFIETVFTFWGKAATQASNWGREDTNKQLNWEEFTGLLRKTPAYDSRDVQWIIKQAKLNGLESHSAIKENFNGYLGKYFDAKSDEEREKAAKELREFATDLRKIWEELDIEDIETPHSSDKKEKIKKQTKKKVKKL